MKFISASLMFALLLSACSNAQPDLKSPCVGDKDSPCERRAPLHQASV